MSRVHRMTFSIMMVAFLYPILEESEENWTVDSHHGIESSVDTAVAVMLSE